MKEIPENILKRIKKLLNLADGAKKVGSIAEAESAALKASELMAEYNLAIHDINLHEDDTPKVGDLILDHFDLNFKNEGDWVIQLYHVISYFNYCRAINREDDLWWVDKKNYDAMCFERNRHPNGSDSWSKVNREIYKKYYTRGWKEKKIKTVRLVGEPMNIEMTKYIVVQLINKVRPLVKDAWKQYDETPFIPDYIETDLGYTVKEKKGQFRRGFLMGFVRGVQRKLSDQKKNMEIKQPQLKTMALTLTNKVDLWVDQNIKFSKGRMRSGGSKSNDGSTMGYAAGLKTTINKGVGSNQLNQKLLK